MAPAESATATLPLPLPRNLSLIFFSCRSACSGAIVAPSGIFGTNNQSGRARFPISQFCQSNHLPDNSQRARADNRGLSPPATGSVVEGLRKINRSSQGISSLVIFSPQSGEKNQLISSP